MTPPVQLKQFVYSWLLHSVALILLEYRPDLLRAAEQGWNSPSTLQSSCKALVQTRLSAKSQEARYKASLQRDCLGCSNNLARDLVVCASHTPEFLICFLPDSVRLVKQKHASH